MKATTEFPLDQDMTLLVTHRGTFEEARTHGWWLHHHGIPVAYCKTLLSRIGHEPHLLLCDIETRPEHRRQGHATRLIDLIETRLGLTLHTSGTFTPDGQLALTRLPLTPGGVYSDVSAMGFVLDWDHLHAM